MQDKPDLSDREAVELGIGLGRRLVSVALQENNFLLVSQIREYRKTPEVLEAALIWMTKVLSGTIAELCPNPQEEWSRFLIENYED